MTKKVKEIGFVLLSNMLGFFETSTLFKTNVFFVKIFRKNKEIEAKLKLLFMIKEFFGVTTMKNITLR